jgi:hypothetical protein
VSFSRWRYVGVSDVDVTVLALSKLVVHKARWLDLRSSLNISNVDELMDRVLGDQSLLGKIRVFD